MNEIKYTYTRERLFSGFDKKSCKVQPVVAFDGENTVILSYQKLLLTGIDVMYGVYVAKSTDGGKTFSKPEFQKALSDTFCDEIRTSYHGMPFYNKKHKKWFGLGRTTPYKNDGKPVLVNGVCAGAYPLYLSLDAEKGEFTGYSILPFPFEYSIVTTAGQLYEYENGDMLIPFYFRSNKYPKSTCVTVRYAMEENGLRIVQVGEPLVADSYERGIGEPSIAYLNGKFYMTIRADEVGLYAESDDGFYFSEPKPWVWDDGTILENYNTQQHWVCNEKGLFLAYTRRGAHNDHVFRHRAPIFMTRFDEDRKCLLRDEEIILVPELGARLGNFNVIEATEKESWLMTAEWMQPRGCEKYGSDNSLWLARIFWE